MIDFDPIRHEYREGGVLLPSVTEILKRVGLIDFRGSSRGPADFGTAVHEATALIDRGEKTLEDYATFDTYKYLEAWCLFNETYHPVILEVEQIVGGVEVGCAGTLDRLVLFPWDPRPCVVDLKTGKAKPWHAVQLAGYCYATQKEYRRMTVYIDGYGVFRAEEYREERDLRIFKGALDFINSELQAGRRI
jgi:CRISPR/Cas system-associated exonuclease Cas4 (RecB family)